MTHSSALSHPCQLSRLWSERGWSECSRRLVKGEGVYRPATCAHAAAGWVLSSRISIRGSKSSHTRRVMAATEETGRDAVREHRELEAGCGRYDFKTIIGEGASAKVWHAFDTVAQRDVAIKEFESWEGSMSQFNREVRILEELNASDTQGKHVVRLLGTFVHDSKSCIVMEYLQGKTLKQIIRESKGQDCKGPGLALPMLLKITRDLLRTLHFLATNEVRL